MIHKIKKKIPKLNSQTETLLQEIEDPKYLDINSDLLVRLKEVNKMEKIVLELIKSKNDI